MCVLFYSSSVCISAYAHVYKNNNHKTKHKNNTNSKQHPYVRGPLQECRSIRSGASGLPYYCAPLVCVSAVIDSLAVWRHNKPKTKNHHLSRINSFKHWHINPPKLLLCLCVVFYTSFVYTCLCVFLHIQNPLRECRSIRSGASGLPYYCTPLVCVSAVIDSLAVSACVAA